MVVMIGRLCDHLDEIWGLRKALKESTHENPENHTLNEQITIEFTKGIEQLNLPGDEKIEYIFWEMNTE